MVSAPTTLNTHVQDHVQFHVSLKEYWQGELAVKEPQELQGPLSTIYGAYVSSLVVVVPPIYGLPPITITTHVQDHVEFHQSVKESWQGQ